MSRRKRGRRPAKKATRDLPLAELLGIAERAKTSPISEAEFATLKAAFDTLAFLTQELQAKGTSIERLRKMLFGAQTEKTENVFPPSDHNGPREGRAVNDERPEPKSKAPGHGRNPAAAYTGAKKVRVPHVELQKGTACPGCATGKVYPLAEPETLVRVQGMAPLGATVYECDRLRCNACGEVFTAEAPEGVGDEKYDATVAAMIGLLKYGAGLPFHRLAKLQAAMGIPLPATTQWEIVYGASKLLAAANDELLRQAAQGEVLHNDDTTVKILELMNTKRDEKDLDASYGTDAPGAASKRDEDERTGTFTTGIVAQLPHQHRVALFFTGTNHAGENLAKVLAHRAAELGSPIQMCDALSRNYPAELETIVANCLAHGRRRFVDVVDHFPDECRHVLENLAIVFKCDADARDNQLSPEERLRLHQAESGPIMVELHAWLTAQIEDRKVEPNSGLGEAISYMLNHWEKLTLFLRVAGAPIENNIVERALKKAILHRKNALFFKTQNGARVGDIFMSLIHTVELNRENPFDYLVALLRHAGHAAANPSEWLPWNYRATLARLVAPPAPPG